MVFHGGLVGVLQDPETLTLTPSSLWCVAPEEHVPEIEIPLNDTGREKVRELVLRLMRRRKDVDVKEIVEGSKGWRSR
jgi:hypothetical protein